MNHRLQFSLLTMVLAVSLAAQSLPQGNTRAMPKGGFVPDSQTAIKIAVAVWCPIYGEGNINKQSPYSATLSKGVWVVEGTLHPTGPTKIVLGGVARARIKKSNAQILEISHGE